MISLIQLRIRFIFSLWLVFISVSIYLFDEDTMWGLVFLTVYFITVPIAIGDMGLGLIKFIRKLLIEDRVKRPRYSSNRYKKVTKIFMQVFIVSIYLFVVLFMLAKHGGSDFWASLVFVYLLGAIIDTVIN